MTYERPYRGLIERLKGVGLRPTRQRLALGKLLFEANGQPCDRHVTAEQLHGEAIGRGVRVSLATVYNTLHQFTESGLLREVVVDSGRSYFDTNTSEHHHFFFENSGRLQDIESSDLLIGNLPASPEGHAISRVDVIVRLKA
jgi:Fur family iron response transcriptional regulator